MSGQDCEQLTFYQVGSPASRSVQPGSAEARMMTVISGQKCLESSVSSGPLGSLEKMLLESSAWRSTRRFLTWKTKVTKRGHLLFRLAALTPHTDVIGARLWPTPKAMDYKGSGPRGSKSAEHDLNRGNLKGVVKYTTEESGQLNPTWVEALMGVPFGWTNLED